MTPEKRAEIAERYGFAPGERDALAAEIAERQRRIKSDEMLQWAKARNAERAEAERQPMAEPTVTKSEAAMTATPTQTTTPEYWDSWRSFIRKTMRADLRKAEDVIASCVGKVLGEIRKSHTDKLDELRAEVTALRNQVSELRSELRMRGSLDEVQARLAKLETPPRLKAMG